MRPEGAKRRLRRIGPPKMHILNGGHTSLQPQPYLRPVGAKHCLRHMDRVTCLFLLSSLFSGPFVGASPKIQACIYRTWPVVDTILTEKMTTMTPPIALAPPLP